MAATYTFRIQAPVLAWFIQPLFPYMPRFGEPVPRWTIQPVEVGVTLEVS